MDNPRPEKVAVVDEVKARLDGADSVVLTDYRGLDVPSMAELRKAVRAAGGEYKIYKNTLVRFAAQQLGLELDEEAVDEVSGADPGRIELPDDPVRGRELLLGPPDDATAGRNIERTRRFHAPPGGIAIGEQMLDRHIRLGPQFPDLRKASRPLDPPSRGPCSLSSTGC